MSDRAVGSQVARSRQITTTRCCNMDALAAYGSDSGPEEDVEFDANDAFGVKKIKTTLTTSRPAKSQELVAEVASAPFVLDKDIMNESRTLITRPDDTQMNVNIAYQDMQQPVQGAENPFEDKGSVKTNTLTGFVEAHAMSDLDFKAQQRSYYVNGYAMNPSLLAPTDETGAALNPYIGNIQAAQQNQGAVVADLKPSKATIRALKRKRKGKGQLGVFDEPGEEEAATVATEDGPEGADPVEAGTSKDFKPKGYLGPWAGWEEEQVDEGPEYEEIEEHVRKSRPIIERSKREVGFGEEKSVFHGKEMHDYQGRTYMSIPRDVDVDLEPEEPGLQQCFIPKRCIHTWSGHTKGVSSFELFPGSGHLLLSGSMDCRVKLWDVYHEGKCLRTFMGHSKAIRDVTFSPDGKRFLSASFDRQIKLWDTETGACLQAFTNQKFPNCVRFHPDLSKNTFLAGMHDKKIVQWDITSGEISQEYDQHLGPVNTITFTDEGRRFVTTSDDKSIRAWDFDIPVVIKYIAEPTMHSMPAVAKSPNQKWLAMQSLDNQILIYSAETFKQNYKKGFRGHTIAGYACKPAFSPDGRFLSSGDASGNVHFWDFKSGKKYPNRLQAHNKVVISQQWLPHETSKLVTASWDGNLKLWD